MNNIQMLKEMLKNKTLSYDELCDVLDRAYSLGLSDGMKTIWEIAESQ